MEVINRALGEYSRATGVSSTHTDLENIRNRRPLLRRADDIGGYASTALMIFGSEPRASRRCFLIQKALRCAHSAILDFGTGRHFGSHQHVPFQVGVFGTTGPWR